MADTRFAMPASSRPSVKGPVLLGLSTVALFFGGFGAWAALAPLSSAAHAPGQVRVESHRKTVQHLEGGIIKEILVREGEIVSAGQVLVRIDDVQASSSADLIAGQRAALLAEEARLVAERDGTDGVSYPPELAEHAADAAIRAIVDGQNRIFASRRASIGGQEELLEQRVLQLAGEIEACRAQLAAADAQIPIVEEELATVQALIKKGLERRPRLLTLQRELASLKGERGKQLGMIARAEQMQGETKLQVADLRNRQMAEITADLREAQTRLAELGDRERAASDVEARTAVVAPQAGQVVQLRHVTPGGVLRPGDPILDIVPLNDKLVIEARISPFDIDMVHPGLQAEIKLTALKQKNLPLITGKVIDVSADAILNESTKDYYYSAQIAFDEEAASSEHISSLQSGMPVDILVQTGTRTAGAYLVDPITDSFRRAFRED